LVVKNLEHDFQDVKHGGQGGGPGLAVSLKILLDFSVRFR